MTSSIDVALDHPSRTIVAVPSSLARDSLARFLSITNALTRVNSCRLVSSARDGARANERALFTLPDAAAAFDVDVSDCGNSTTVVVVTYEDVGVELRRERGCGVAFVADASGELRASAFTPLLASDSKRDIDDDGDEEMHGFSSVKIARAHARHGTLMTVDETRARAWTLDASGYRASTSMATRECESRSHAIAQMNTTQDGVSGGEWCATTNDVFTCGVDGDVATFDIRRGARVATISKAHATQTRDVRYNPNKSHEIMTCGDDGLVKFWDTRASERAVKVVAGHDHWIWRCAYNPVYDSLFLTASSDGGVRLWSDDTKVPHEHTNATVHRDRARVRMVTKRSSARATSAHAAAWSAVDPWTYASINASGVVSICEIPREEKYRILL